MSAAASQQKVVSEKRKIYKSEHVMSFNTFLDRMQNIFNIFRDNMWHMEDSMQVSELFSTINHPQLQDTVKSLEVRSNLDGIKYSEAANHLITAVSNMNEY